jgi:adenosylcobinamide kinase/adenosylcobinamide-phosphate guanylyltransferase
MKTLVLGGARSGKSRHAEKLAASTDKQKIYIATAQALDTEMQQRITRHQHDRGNGWHTIEEPLLLAETLAVHVNENKVILVDCLTLWLTNLLLAGENIFMRERKALLHTLPQLTGDIIFVSNEVGLGIVAADVLSRRFVDEAGHLHQALAAQCERVHFLVAGLAQNLK